MENSRGKIWKIWWLRNHLAWKNIRFNIKNIRVFFLNASIHFACLEKVLFLFIIITGDACLTRNSYVFRVHLLLLFIGAVCWDQQSSGHLFQTNQPLPVWLPLLSWVMWPHRRHFNVGHHGIVWCWVVDDSVPFPGKTSDRNTPSLYLIHTQVNHVLERERIREWTALELKINL